MITQDQKRRLDELTTKYKYSFYIHGSITNPYNTLRLAAFVSLKKPTEYESFQVDDDKSLIFYNIATQPVITPMCD